MCHLVLMMPIFSLAAFWLWPFRVALPIYLVVVSLSAVVYFAIFRAAHQPIRSGREGMIGETGKVIDPLIPDGSVRIHGELWKAIGLGRISRGDKVEVVDVQGITVLVRKAGQRVELNNRTSRCPLSPFQSRKNRE